MKEILFILWMLCSIILVCSLIGMILFIPKDTYTHGPSTWCTIGIKLIESITDVRN